MDVYWFEQASADVPANEHWLSAAEAARASAMRFAKRRDDWRLGRWTAKQAIAARLGVDTLARIEVLPAPGGAPEVFIDSRPVAVTISISHRAGRAVCGVAPAWVALGCDLELVEARSNAFATDYFTAEEQALIAATESVERQRMLALLWSAKESVLKALRVGLRFDTRSVCVDPECASGQEQGIWRPFRARCDGQDFRGRWQYAGDLVRTLAVSPVT